MIWWLTACDSATPTPATVVEPLEACEGDTAGTEITISPYLQQATPTSIHVMWETDAGTASGVQFGTEALDQTVCADPVPIVGGLSSTSSVHRVFLDELTPATTYQYRVQTGSLQSEIHTFTTPPDPAAEASFQLVAMSDAQRDDDHPRKFEELVNQGVLPTVAARYPGELDRSLGMVLFPGDLVDNGWLRDEWVTDFFGQGKSLWSRVPLYPALGNHEGNSPLYFQYFHLPEDEHVYTVDYSNLRVITLDSNPSFATSNQLVWLQDQLDRTCHDPTIDFVFAQLHHPWKSELWIPGNTDWTGSVVDLLGRFSTDCGKPSIHFYGHTHGYARGESQDHQHLMVNVASAGGRLDRWGEQEQQDYPEFAVSEDEYGFVIVEVVAGDTPSFEVLRFSRGTPENPRDNELTDRFKVRLHNHAPATPTVNFDCSMASGSPFSDEEGDSHQSTAWEVSDCAGHVLASQWRQHANRYAGVDTQAGDDLTDEPFADLGAGMFCVRARYRDDGLVWSEWSEPAQVTCP